MNDLNVENPLFFDVGELNDIFMLFQLGTIANVSAIFFVSLDNDASARSDCDENGFAGICMVNKSFNCCFIIPHTSRSKFGPSSFE